MSEKRYTIAEETRKRCKVMQMTPEIAQRMRPMNLELYDYLFEPTKINFSIFFQVEDSLVEYIKPEDFCKELLERLEKATRHPHCETGIYLLKEDYPKFESVINAVRNKKLRQVVYDHPELDRKTLAVYAQMSAASQMIVEGGITSEVAARAQKSTAIAISEVLDNPASAGTISRMINIDSTLYDHSASVAMFAGIIADKYFKNQHRSKLTQMIVLAGLFHDVGKSCLPYHVLNKPGKLTDDEYEIIKKHPDYGYLELQKAVSSGAQIDPLIARVALEHHEKFGGGGYPFQKKGKAEQDPQNGIHIFTRIVTIADVYSALLMKRCYKEPMTPEQALEMMKEFGDEHFDMEIFKSFVEGIESSVDMIENVTKDKSRIIMLDDNESLAQKLQTV